MFLKVPNESQESDLVGKGTSNQHNKDLSLIPGINMVVAKNHLLFTDYACTNPDKTKQVNNVKEKIECI